MAHLLDKCFYYFQIEQLPNRHHQKNNSTGPFPEELYNVMTVSAILVVYLFSFLYGLEAY
jgi:hypothetical protein